MRNREANSASYIPVENPGKEADSGPKIITLYTRKVRRGAIATLTAGVLAFGVPVGAVNVDPLSNCKGPQITNVDTLTNDQGKPTDTVTATYPANQGAGGSNGVVTHVDKIGTYTAAAN